MRERKRESKRHTSLQCWAPFWFSPLSLLLFSASCLFPLCSLVHLFSLSSLTVSHPLSYHDFTFHLVLPLLIIHLFCLHVSCVFSSSFLLTIFPLSQAVFKIPDWLVQSAYQHIQLLIPLLLMRGHYSLGYCSWLIETHTHTHITVRMHKDREINIVNWRESASWKWDCHSSEMNRILATERIPYLWFGSVFVSMYL